MSVDGNAGDLENFPPFWIFNHLGEKLYMADEVAQLSSSPKDDPPSPEGSPSVSIPPPIERENNIMTQGELDRFRGSYSIPSNVQIRLPEANKTIAPTRARWPFLRPPFTPWTTTRIYRLAGQLQSQVMRVSLTIPEMTLAKAIIPKMAR